MLNIILNGLKKIHSSHDVSSHKWHLITKTNTSWNWQNYVIFNVQIHAWSTLLSSSMIPTSACLAYLYVDQMFLREDSMSDHVKILDFYSL